MTEAPIRNLTMNMDALEKRAKFHKLGDYDPYPFQMAFHERRAGKWINGTFEGHGGGGEAFQTLLSAGNQSGKTEAGGSDMAYHATGEYPVGWKGPDLSKILKKYPLMWAGGANNDTVRDIGQNSLCGDPLDPTSLGTGWIPKDAIVSKVLKPNVRNAFNSVSVRHKDGMLVSIGFKSYESGELDWAGRPVALIWLDEEPPYKLYSQCMARTTASQGYLGMTFTPEKGATQVVSGFLTDLKDGQQLLLVGHDDACHPDGRTHLNPIRRKQLEQAYMPHERDMRIRGLPVLGSGSVFPIALNTILCSPFLIPDEMPRICGLDFGSGGSNHPTAAAWFAFDPDAKTGWWYDAYKSPETQPAIHAAAIRGRGDWIPCTWPHDGHRREAYANGVVATGYRNLGLRLLSSHATNDDGSNAVEPGIFEMYQAMTEGRFKIFETLTAVHQEFGMYHRDENNQIVDRGDDLMSAGRLAYISRRKAIPKGRADRPQRSEIIPGTHDYDPRGDY